MNVERHCKHWVGTVYDCQKYGRCPWDAEGGNDCREWCGVQPDPEEPAEPARGYARSGL